MAVLAYFPVSLLLRGGDGSIMCAIPPIFVNGSNRTTPTHEPRALVRMIDGLDSAKYSDILMVYLFKVSPAFDSI